jgi:hypothetical protein
MNPHRCKLQSCKYGDDNSGGTHKNVENLPEPRDSAKTDHRAEREGDINGPPMPPPEVDNVVHRGDAHET